MRVRVRLFSFFVLTHRITCMSGMVLVDGTEEGKSKAGVDDGVGIPKACRYLFLSFLLFLLLILFLFFFLFL